MTDPVDRVIRDFADLGLRTYDIGRSFVDRTILYNGFHRFLKGYVSANTIVSIEALPFRPHRGVFVVIADSPEPTDAKVAQWCNDLHIPAMLRIDGISGAYWYKSVMRLGRGGEAIPAQPTDLARHFFIYFLDRDPLEVTAEIASQIPGWFCGDNLPGLSSGTMTLALAAPYESIMDPQSYHWAER
jgi:hypothetical protein